MAEPSDSWTTLCGQASQAVAEACELFGPGTQQCLRARRIHQLKGCPTLHVGQSLAEQYRRELARLADSTGISEDGQDLLEAQTTTKVPSTKDDFFAGQGKSSASKQIIELGETKPGSRASGITLSLNHVCRHSGAGHGDIHARRQEWKILYCTSYYTLQLDPDETGCSVPCH